MTDTNKSALVNLTLDDFLSAVAKRASTPGGGAVAAAAGALAACLARMVTGYSVPNDEEGNANHPAAQILVRLIEFDVRLRSLVDEDAQAYEAYVAASRDKSGRPEALERREAVTRMSMEVPMQIASASNDVLGALQELTAVANKWLLSDLEASAILAEAAVRAAGCFVRVNAAALKDEAGANSARLEVKTLEESAGARLSEVLKLLRSLVKKTK